MRRPRLALAILALAILACAPELPMLPTSTPVALAISPTPTHKLPTHTPVALAIVTAESLHVRVRPGEHERVAGYLYHDNPVTLTGACRDGWAEIVWKQTVAWVNSRYLSDNRCKE
jgi:uncharacterized protein YgiM (DUF1202 family)